MNLRSGAIINNNKHKRITNKLLLYIKNGNCSVHHVKYILNRYKKIRVNIQDENGDTSLTLAVKKKKPDVVHLLLQHENINIYIKNNNILAAYDYCRIFSRHAPSLALPEDRKNTVDINCMFKKIFKTNIKKYLWFLKLWSVGKCLRKQILQ